MNKKIIIFIVGVVFIIIVFAKSSPNYFKYVGFLKNTNNENAVTGWNDKLPKSSEFSNFEEGVKQYIADVVGWKTKSNSKVFAAFTVLDEQPLNENLNFGNIEYIKYDTEVLIEEYSKTKSDSLSGMRGPLILIVKKNKRANSFNVLWHIEPGEGSDYGKSIRKMFSKKSVDIIFPEQIDRESGNKTVINEIDEKNAIEIERQRKEHLGNF